MDLFGGDMFKYTFTDDIVEQDTVIDQLNSVYKDTKELVERMKKAAGDAYSDMDIEAETKKLEQLRKQLTWFGVDPETTNAAKSQTDWVAKMISLVKDMNKSYEDLNKTFDKTSSEMNTMTSFKDAFNEIFKDTDISLFKTSSFFHSVYLNFSISVHFLLTNLFLLQDVLQITCCSYLHKQPCITHISKYLPCPSILQS